MTQDRDIVNASVYCIVYAKWILSDYFSVFRDLHLAVVIPDYSRQLKLLATL